MVTRLTNRNLVYDNVDLLAFESDDPSSGMVKLLDSVFDALESTENGRGLVDALSFYFSLPNNERLRYPCCIFEFQNFDQREADNRKYISNLYLTMTFISNNGRLAYASKNVLSIPYCSFDRYFKTDHLHHMVYRLYIKDDLNG